MMSPFFSSAVLASICFTPFSFTAPCDISLLASLLLSVKPNENSSFANEADGWILTSRPTRTPTRCSRKCGKPGQLSIPQRRHDQGVTVQKSTAAPLIMFALYSPSNTYDGVFLANYAVINVHDQMTRVTGIASVSVFGAGNTPSASGCGPTAWRRSASPCRRSSTPCSSRTP